MADEEPDIVDSVTEATNGIGSEALAAISNLGGGSGSAASSVLSRIGATISGQAGGFAPKVITTVTKHGLAAIDRVEPIQGVDRGYRAVARDANGLESIRTVLDLDPREYDVTVTREDGVAIVEFVQQEPEPALPPGGADGEADTAASNESSPEPMAPVKEAGPADRGDRAPETSGAAPVNTDGSTRVEPTSARSAPAGAQGGEVERARAEAEKAKARAEAEKAQAEAEKAKAEAAAAKARAEAERAKAEADAEAVRSELEAGGKTDSVQNTGPAENAASAENPDPSLEHGESQFSASRDLESGFEVERRDSEEAGDTAGGWGLREETSAIEETSTSDEAPPTDSGSAEDGGFGEFTPATPVEDEPAEYADGGAIETSISVNDGDSTQDAVADGGTEDDADEDTGKFQF